MTKGICNQGFILMMKIKNHHNESWARLKKNVIEVSVQV